MEEIICFCKNISKTEIEPAIQQGAQTIKDIQDATGARTGIQCREFNPNGRCCSVEIATMLNNKDNEQQKQYCCCS
jgi:bacterioferritin-associated ferredoxin